MNVQRWKLSVLLTGLPFHSFQTTRFLSVFLGCKPPDFAQRNMKLFVKVGVKVLVAALLSLAAGGAVWYACKPRLVCDEPYVVRESISIKKDQTFFEHTYILRNRSLRTIKLDSVKSSCTCQSVEVPDPVIPPFGEGKITARFKVARNAVGVRHAEALVFAAKRSAPMLRLQMTYSFELGVWAYPEQIDLGRIVIDKPVAFTIHVRQAKAEGRQAHAVRSVDAEGISFEIHPIREGLSTDGAVSGNATLLEQTVSGRFSNDFKAGYHDKTVTIQTDHPDYPVLTVPVRWESVVELSFTPTVLHFGIMAPASAATRSTTLIAESGPLQVRRAEVSGDGFRLESQKQIASNRVEFVVGTDAGTVPGIRKGRLTVETEDGKSCRSELMAIVE